MLRVASQLTNQSVVVRMGIVAKSLLPLQHDHREAVRVGFFEVLAHALHGFNRRRISGASGTECSRPTVSSHGTPKLTVRVSATHARMMNTANLRIVRAMKGGL